MDTPFHSVIRAWRSAPTNLHSCQRSKTRKRIIDTPLQEMKISEEKRGLTFIFWIDLFDPFSTSNSGTRLVHASSSSTIKSCTNGRPTKIIKKKPNASISTWIWGLGDEGCNEWVVIQDPIKTRYKIIVTHIFLSFLNRWFYTGFWWWIWMELLVTGCLLRFLLSLLLWTGDIP